MSAITTVIVLLVPTLSYQLIGASYLEMNLRELEHQQERVKHEIAETRDSLNKIESAEQKLSEQFVGTPPEPKSPDGGYGELES